MSKQPDKKNKLTEAQVKLLEDLAALSKTYKQSCKRQGTTTYSPFLQSISACEATVQPITKVA